MCHAFPHEEEQGTAAQEARQVPAQGTHVYTGLGKSDVLCYAFPHEEEQGEAAQEAGQVPAQGPHVYTGLGRK